LHRRHLGNRPETRQRAPNEDVYYFKELATSVPVKVNPYLRILRIFIIYKPLRFFTLLAALVPR